VFEGVGGDGGFDLEGVVAAEAMEEVSAGGGVEERLAEDVSGIPSMRVDSERGLMPAGRCRDE